MKTEFNDTRLGVAQPVRVEFTRYARGGAIAIELICADEENFGEPWITASVNVPGVPEGCVAVKDYSEGDGTVELLHSAGVIEGEPVKQIAAGFVNIPVFKLSAEAMKAATQAVNAAGEENSGRVRSALGDRRSDVCGADAFRRRH